MEGAAAKKENRTAMEGAAAKEENRQHQVLRVLEALKQASHELQTNPSRGPPDSNSSAVKALLELDADGHPFLSSDPHLSSLSHLLSNLKTSFQNLQTSRHRHGLRSFLTRRVSSQEISRVAVSIESEIQSWIDRETIETLSQTLQGCESSSSLQSNEEEALIEAIDQFRFRVGQGYNRDLQDLILKSKVFKELESVVSSANFSKKVRENVASAIAELIEFNKDVFVGQVLMGQTIQAVISLCSLSSLKVLCSLVKSIKSPLVDELESSGGIAKIVSFLNSEDLSIRIIAFNCVLEIGYFGRKEAIEAMMNASLIKKLVELQRGELGGDLIDVGKIEAEAEKERGEMEEEVKKNVRRRRRENGEVRYLERHPFASSVARFAVQLEVGEGLRQREKRAFKQEILKKVREASLSDAEAATIIAEVLWGSSP